MGQGRLSEVIMRDTRANQPLASAVSEGTLFYVTDEEVTERSSGVAWETYSDSGDGISELTGDVTAGPGSGSQAATIANDAVTFAKMQNIATDRLIGRDTAASGDPEEISLGAGLAFTGAGAVALTAAARVQQIGITIDGGGSPITTGIKGYKSFPVAGTILDWRLLADVAGDVEFDIFKDPFASYPPTTSIVAAAPPELSGVDNGEDNVLTGWTTAVAAGDVFGFEIVGSPATITRVTLELSILVS